MSDDPKPKRIGFERKEARPQHDRPGERMNYGSSKELFASMMDEAKDG